MKRKKFRVEKRGHAFIHAVTRLGAELMAKDKPDDFWDWEEVKAEETK
jgi:hypothetical protein